MFQEFFGVLQSQTLVSDKFVFGGENPDYSWDFVTENSQLNIS